jgi:hypothetical protein
VEAPWPRLVEGGVHGDRVAGLDDDGVHAAAAFALAVLHFEEGPERVHRVFHHGVVGRVRLESFAQTCFEQGAL